MGVFLIAAIVGIPTGSLGSSVHGCNFISGQEASTRAARSPHRMIMSGFVQIWLSSFRGEAKRVLEFLTRHASLQNPMKLLRVDVQRRLFRRPGHELR
jgi:hypothetical protein